MNPRNERYSDLIGDQDDPALLACIADLDATCATFVLPAERDADLARSLTVEAGKQGQRATKIRLPRRAWLHAPWQAARWRLASLTLAVLVAVGGIGAYLHGQSPTPVNAQTVLHRAAAVSPGPNEATHAIYRLSVSGGYTGAAEVWVGADANGFPAEFALTVTMVRAGNQAPDLSSRSVVVLADQRVQEYDPASNTVTISPVGYLVEEREGMFVGTLVAQKISRALNSNNQQKPFRLQQTTLDGVSVYALQFSADSSSNQTFYFNTQSYVLEGADWAENGKSWQARLDPNSYQVMALSAVPPHTFTLNAPATARVVTITPPEGSGKGSAGQRPVGPPDKIISAAAAACHTTPQAFEAALQKGDKSMLAICQETTPGMTADRLVAALIAPFKSELDAKVASGTMTPAEEAANLSNLQTKLTHMVSDQPGMKPGTKPGGK